MEVFLLLPSTEFSMGFLKEREENLVMIPDYLYILAVYAPDSHFLSLSLLIDEHEKALWTRTVSMKNVTIF